MKQKQWLDVDDYMKYKDPIPRDKWKRSNEWSFQSIDIPKRKFDKDKCPVCGGNGRVWADKDLGFIFNNKKSRRRTNIECPRQDCEHVRKY